MSRIRQREAALRGALLSAAEQIEPAPGGLDRIQARLRPPRPLLVAWLEAAWATLVMRALIIMPAVGGQAREVLRLVWDRFGPVTAPGAGSGRLSWLRPLAAMSVAVFVLGAGVYVALDRPTSIFPAGSSSRGLQGSGGSHSPRPRASGRSTTLGKASRPAGSTAASASASPGCLPRYQSAAPPSADASIQPPTATPTVTPTPATTPTPSTSVSPSSSPSGTTSPATADSTSPSAGGAATTPAAPQLSGVGSRLIPASAQTALSGATRSATASPAASAKARKSSPRPCPTSTRNSTRTAAPSAKLISGRLAGKVTAKLD